MFDKMKNLYELQQKARELKKQLEGITLERKSHDGLITLRVNGMQRIQSLSIDPQFLSPDQKDRLETSLKMLISEAFEEIQKKSAEQSAALMKGMNIPGL